MSRARADLLLLLVAIIWGTTFIAQKLGMRGLGACSFVGVRFLITTIVTLPFAILELRRKQARVAKKFLWPLLALCMVFTAAVILQQQGTMLTSVTNAGFLTGLYVILVPVVDGLLFRKMPGVMIGAACVLSVVGVWCLNGATLTHLNYGDVLILICALGFAAQISVMGYLTKATGLPVTLAVMQYACCSAVGLAAGLAGEQPTLAAIKLNLLPLLYAGVISGGIAYTLQGVAQQYTSAAKTAIIGSSEALFAALAAVIILHENLTLLGGAGCVLIFMAIALTQMNIFPRAIVD